MPKPFLPIQTSVDDPTTKQPRTIWLKWFQFLDSLIRGTPALCTITYGTGSPESVVVAPIGSLFIRTDGGASTVLYIKEANTTAIGWRAV